jgi:hypothetical protein
MIFPPPEEQWHWHPVDFECELLAFFQLRLYHLRKNEKLTDSMASCCLMVEEATGQWLTSGT